MPAKTKQTQKQAPKVEMEEDLEAEILSLVEDEPDEYKENQEEETQQILKLDGFIRDIMKDVNGSALVEIFYFADKALKFENFLDNSNVIYQQPVFVKISDGNRKAIKGFGLVKLQERYGENYGISYNQTRSRKLQDENPLNVLRVDVRTEKDYKGFKYYDMRNFAASPKDTAANKIKEMYYEQAQPFKKSKRAQQQAEDYDGEAKFIEDNA
jgi:hypothetical protein